MSDWTHFTGGFGLDGFIFENGRWITIENEIIQLISPLPTGWCEELAKYKIKLHSQNCMHFADVLVSDDLEDYDLYGIEKWLLSIENKLSNHGWSIRCGCFYAYVEDRDPAVYYFSDEGWRKIENINGVLLSDMYRGDN